MDKTHFSRTFLQILGILLELIKRQQQQLLHFYLRSFFLYVSFSKRAVQIFGGFMDPLHSPKK